MGLALPWTLTVLERVSAQVLREGGGARSDTDTSRPPGGAFPLDVGSTGSPGIPRGTDAKRLENKTENSLTLWVTALVNRD